MKTPSSPISKKLLSHPSAFYPSFLMEIFQSFFAPSIHWKKLLTEQMVLVGWQSLGVISLSSFLVGGVFSIQFGKILKTFAAESLVGAAASYALAKELAPVLTAFLLAGRVGSAMTAELAAMTTQEQVDALRMMKIPPIPYLVIPRVLASILMTPLLCCLFLIIGMISSIFVAKFFFHTDMGMLLAKISWMTQLQDIFQGLLKSFIFSIAVSTISCHKGLQAFQGPKGVGKNTTEAVVTCLITILALDCLITIFWV